MKLLGKYVDKGMQGNVTLMPEESEDMWHAYNLIAEGDSVRSTTIRKVQNETATGSSTSSRVRTTLTIAVESIDFDTQACVLRLKGRNIEENQYVKMGAYHTLDLELNRKFELRNYSLIKQKDQEHDPRCQDVNLRKEYVNLVESVRDAGGEVKIFSSMHISGEQLAQLTGIAALLRFPMPELEDSDDDDDEDGAAGGDNSDSD
ncbi:protein pelota [Drosophila innubila]|uniref:protein pelota n=1 Tax=Drosophila innubila TaxID=198719 RepID=UPI00148E6972|nr:protein pelota [Drosophila innubila]